MTPICTYCGKVAYPTRGEAITALRGERRRRQARARRRGGRAVKVVNEVYRCPEGSDAWHLTS